jgi:membrane-bound metal-dependent hydrolase YbcI (DUF457 family)
VWRETEGQNMNKIYVLRKDELRGELYRRIYLLIRISCWTRQSIGASVGLAGGLLSIILGAMVWPIVPLLVPGSFRAFLNVVEIVLFALSLPLLALGAYCLDLLEMRAPILPIPTEPQPYRVEHWHYVRAQHPNKN